MTNDLAGYAGYKCFLLHVRDKSTLAAGVEPVHIVSLRVVIYTVILTRQKVVYKVVNTTTG